MARNLVVELEQNGIVVIRASSLGCSSLKCGEPSRPG
jgi:Holliday junction resolvase